MRMRVKKLGGVLFILCLALGLFAQVDSTFVRYYSPTYETHPYWYSFPTSFTDAANVFEKYDGNFGMQILSTYHTPPPELIFPQSPVATYNRRGEYINTTFGPYNDDGLLVGYYSHIIKDGYGGYLALDMVEHRIHRLNSDLQFVEWVPLLYFNGTPGCILDLISEDNGFVVVANSGGYVIAKFSYDLTCLWSTPFTAHTQICLKKLGDGAFVNMWWYSPHYQVMKISSMGDTIWTKQLQDYGVDSFIEINNNFYGFIYDSVDINTGELRVYDFGVDFENESPGDPILVIPTYPLLDSNLYGLSEPFSVIKTSDNCIVLAVSTPGGEIFKFDSNFNLIWSSNALQNERIGIGNHPLIELGNGDLLYCATVGYQPRQLALVRIDSNGNYVGIDDPTTPALQNGLLSAYPNPFTTFTNLKVILPANQDNSLPRVTTESIDIYNIKGQKVKNIFLDPNKVSEQFTYWDGRDADGKQCSSGIYFLNLSVNGKRYLSKKVTLFR